MTYDVFITVVKRDKEFPIDDVLLATSTKTFDDIKEVIKWTDSIGVCFK